MRGGQYHARLLEQCPSSPRRALRGGWYHTGDAGYMDEEGFVYIVDRLKGHDHHLAARDVYSAEVENAISTLDGVAEVAVIGIPDEKWGEAVHAIVVPLAGRTVSQEQVVAHCHHVDRRLQVSAQRNYPQRTDADLWRRQNPQERPACTLLGWTRGAGQLTDPSLRKHAVRATSASGYETGLFRFEPDQ